MPKSSPNPKQNRTKKKQGGEEKHWPLHLITFPAVAITLLPTKSRTNHQTKPNQNPSSKESHSLTQITQIKSKPVRRLENHPRLYIAPPPRRKKGEDGGWRVRFRHFLLLVFLGSKPRTEWGGVAHKPGLLPLHLETELQPLFSPPPTPMVSAVGCATAGEICGWELSALGCTTRGLLGK
jgi:hypothetical protein